MRRVLLLAVGLACGAGVRLVPAACAEDVDGPRVDALVAAVLRVLDRVASVEQVLAPRPPSDLGAVAPSARPGEPAGTPAPAAAADLPDGWLMWQGLPFPARGRFKHHHSVVEGGPASVREVSSKGVYLLKQTAQPTWLERAELRLQTDYFAADAGGLPGGVQVWLVMRSYTRNVDRAEAMRAAKGLMLLSRGRELPSGVGPSVWTEDAVEGANVELTYTMANWRLPLSEFLAWIQAPADQVGIGWGGPGKPALVFKGPGLNAARDLASRITPVGSAPAKPSAPAPKPAQPGAPPAGTSPPAVPAPVASPQSLGVDTRVIEAGLAWLAAHQSPDGSWSSAEFDRWCDGSENRGEKPDGPGKAMYDVGVTGLALAAFLEAGYTTRGTHAYVEVVRRGLAYLVKAQDPEGCFGVRSTQHYIYSHGIAAHAMVEAYGASRSVAYHAAAQRGLDFLVLARNPYFVWRYGVKPGDNDTSVTAWVYGAVAAAARVNAEAVARGEAALLKLDDEIGDGCRAWLDKLTDPDSGRVGYLTRGSGGARPQELIERFPAEQTESMTAAAMWIRLQLGDDPRDPILQKGAALLAPLRPRWTVNQGNIDFYYWYYGTLALRRMGGTHWTAWRAAARSALTAEQRTGAPCTFGGSWDPVDPWGSDGGRVYATAMAVRILAACR